MNGGVTRHFVTVDGRQVHYRRVGEGPPVIVIHESPMTGQMMMAFAKDLASFRFCCIVLDTPGYGLSEPMPPTTTGGAYGPKITIADYADGIARTAAALGLARPHVYGSHTGAVMALEVGCLHPERVGSIIVDGIPTFNRQEVIDQSKKWLVTYPPRTDGTHLLALWSRHRDHRMFYPFYRLLGAERMELDLPEPRYLHDRVVDWLHAGTDYTASYNAVYVYDWHQRLRELSARTALTAHHDDLLGPFMDRLPDKLNGNITRARMPKSEHASWLARFLHADHSPDAPPPPESEPATRRVTAAYLQTEQGQMLVRRAGTSHARPLVLLPDTPDTSSGFQQLLLDLSQHRPVVAVDLPGTGGSDPLPHAQPTVEQYVRTVTEGLRGAHITGFDVYGRGAGCEFAVELAHQNSANAVTLENPAPHTDEVRQHIVERKRVSLEPDTEGTHLLRAWTAIRDRELFTPWYDRTASAVRRVDIAPAAELHRRVFEVLKAIDTWDLPERAAMAYPLRERIDTLTGNVTMTTSLDGSVNRLTPRSVS